MAYAISAKYYNRFEVVRIDDLSYLEKGLRILIAKFNKTKNPDDISIPLNINDLRTEIIDTEDILPDGMVRFTMYNLDIGVFWKEEDINEMLKIYAMNYINNFGNTLVENGGKNDFERRN